MKNCLAPHTLKCVNTDFRNYYRRKTTDKIDQRLHHYDNDRIIQLFLKKLRESMVEYRAGVHIDKIGYFFIYKHPFKFHKTPHFKHLNPYMPTFIPTENSVVRYWSMDFKFNRTLTTLLKKNVKQGYRYLNLIKGVSKVDYMYIGAPANSIKNKNK